MFTNVNNKKLRNRVTETAKEQVTEGTVVVEQATAGIIRLSKNVISAAEVVNELKEGTQSIGEVLNVIDGIAEQTNLLLDSAVFIAGL